MFKWITKLLNPQHEKASENDVEQTSRKPDISEPVISFVQCVKDNPRRFKVSRWIDNRHPKISSIVVSIQDKQTTEKWELREVDFITTSIRRYVGYPDFLTDDEIMYLEKEIVPLFEQRYRALRNIRNQRKAQKERERLKSVYCDK